MKKGAIFDMDGLLLDMERLYMKCWAETAEAFGQAPPPDFPSAVSGTTGQIQRDIILRYFPQVDAAAMQTACISHVDSILDREGAPEKPGARALLEFLRTRGVRTALASSGTRQRIRTNLRHAGLTEAFDEIAGGQDVERGKPEPDIFLLAAERLGCAPGDCYVFEDSANGVRAGVAAGCVTVLVPDLVPPPADLTGYTAICKSLLEVREMLEAGKL